MHCRVVAIVTKIKKLSRAQLHAPILWHLAKIFLPRNRKPNGDER